MLGLIQPRPAGTGLKIKWDNPGRYLNQPLKFAITKTNSVAKLNGVVDSDGHGDWSRPAGGG